MDAHSLLMLRLHRAAEHLDTLDEEISASRDPDALSIYGDKEPKSGRKILRIRIHHEPPSRLGLLAGEVSFQLRSALNNIVASIARQADVPVTRDHQFPIIRDQGQWTPANIRRWLRGLNDDQVAVVEECQPYRAQDPQRHPLLALAALTNADKHRAIPASFVMLGEADIEVSVPDGVNEVTDFEWPTMRGSAVPLHDGAELCRFLTLPDPDAKVEVKWDSVLPLGFGEPMPATLTDLNRMIELVRHLVDSLVPVGRG